MRKRIIIAAAVVVVLLAGWLIDNRQGAALEGGGFGLSAPVAGQNVDLFVMGPGLVNRSRTSVELVRMTPEISGPGLEFVEARVYRRGDFLNGVPTSWSIGDGGMYTPLEVNSVPVAGLELAGKASLDDRVVLLRFRVTTERRPLGVTAVRVTYRHGVREHTQVMQAAYQFIPRPALAG